MGTRSAIGGHNVLTIVAETGKPARVDGYDDASGEAAEIARRFGWRSSIAAPIVVEDRLWGVMLVATQRSELFPAGSEERLAAFTDLLATALANTEARHALERVAADQAALRRVATLVANGGRPEPVFACRGRRSARVVRLEPVGHPAVRRRRNGDNIGDARRGARRRNTPHSPARSGLRHGHGSQDSTCSAVRDGRPDRREHARHRPGDRPALGGGCSDLRRGRTVGSDGRRIDRSFPSPDTERRLARLHRARRDSNRERQAREQARGRSSTSRRRSGVSRRSLRARVGHE